jgi:membrane-bound serine protease (ClpP class)
VIDLIADDLDDLLDGFDQRVLVLGDGTQITLHTAGAEIREVPMSLVEQLLSILINPNIAFLLLTIGVQAILIEISAPGGWAAGFIGALCLALAAYAFGVLPFNWLGLLLIGTAFVLFVLDIKAPTHGALTAAGAGTFIAGALILFNAPATSPYGRLSVPLVVAVSVMLALFFAFVIAKALRAQRPRPTTGKEGLTGRVGVVKVRLDPTGSILVAGERWQATSDEAPIEAGERVEVVSVQGLRLRVRREE